MKFIVATLLVAAFASIALPTAFASCNTQPYGACGSSKTGASCCPDSFYCQPWDAGYYQCMPQPEKCAKQRTNVDYPGNDLETLFGIQPGDCCKRCAQTPGCVGYTFVNSRPGQPACYLKKALGHEREMAGAVSGVLNSVVPTAKPTPTAPNGRCTTAAYGNCGNSHGASCCPKGQYCQPWSPQYYQCMDAPAGCTSQLTDTDYPGNDLKKLALGSPGECCKACKDDKQCKAYTFINYSANGPACFLKTAAGASKRLVGAVSAKL